MLSVLVGPRDAVAVVIATGFFSSGIMAVGLRDRIDRPVLGRLLLGATVGLPIGVVGLRELDEDVLRLALAGVLLVMVVVLASGYTLRSSNPRLEAGAGLVSGLLNGSLGTGGPPVIVVLHAAATKQHAFRATTSSFFAVCDVVAIPLIVWSAAHADGVVAGPWHRSPRCSWATRSAAASPCASTRTSSGGWPSCCSR